VVSLEVLGKLRLVRLQIADDADHDRIALRDLEHPQVVFDPWARLDLDRADHAERDGEPAITIGVRSDWRGGRRTAVWRALRTRGIEKVNVRIDDRNRRLPLRVRGPRRRGGTDCSRDASQESPA
jgi:hypothetical protein